MLRAIRTAAAIFGLVTAGESVACAQAVDDPISLSWVTPRGSNCPDTSYVLAELRRYVGAGRAAKDRPATSASATINVTATGFRLLLKTTQGKTYGERGFQDESCRALADAAVVILAWMIAPEAMAERSAPPPPAPAVPSAAPPGAPAPALTTKRLGPTPFAGLAAAADVGTMPYPAFGAEGHVGVAFERLSLQARGGYWPTRRKSVAALASGIVPGATFSLWSVVLETCLQTLRDPTRSHSGLALCVGPELDVVHGAGFGVSAPTEASAAWVSFAGALQGRIAFAPGAKLFLFLSAVLPLQQQHFALRGVGEIYEASAVATRSSLGLELDL